MEFPSFQKMGGLVHDFLLSHDEGVAAVDHQEVVHPVGLRALYRHDAVAGLRDDAREVGIDRHVSRDHPGRCQSLPGIRA